MAIAAPRELDRHSSLISLTRLAKPHFYLQKPTPSDFRETTKRLFVIARERSDRSKARRSRSFFSNPYTKADSMDRHALQGKARDDRKRRF